jgi:DNA invertase Pin-like site-specific DNA recombinase
MKEQELEYHVRNLEVFFSNASAQTRQGMRPGIEKMIRSLKSGNARMPLSLRRLERRMALDTEDDLFDNMPV